MRISIKLLAPISILATALYLAFLATNHAKGTPLPTSPGHDDFTIVSVPVQPEPEAPGSNIKPKTKMRPTRATVGVTHP